MLVLDSSAEAFETLDKSGFACLKGAFLPFGLREELGLGQASASTWVPFKVPGPRFREAPASKKSPSSRARGH